MTTTTHAWTSADYGAVRFSGAKKLADSHVAPLVAQARGYYIVNSVEDVKAMVADKVRSDNPAAAAKRLRAMVANSEDFLVLPWHRIDNVLSGESKPDSLQIRPSRPIELKGAKKPPKYELLAGHSSVMDLHPATTADWFNAARTVLITEGVIKGDSAVTAQLLHAGITPDELAWIEGATPQAARTQLSRLMERIEQTERVPVISLIGVGNWRQNAEWQMFSLRDRKVLVAFDGDLRENRQVWIQADKLMDFLGEGSRKANPVLLDLGGPNASQFAVTAGYHRESDDSFNATRKIGLDDFLSHVGGKSGGSAWGDLMKLQETSLPPKPAAKDTDEVVAGAWRVTEDGLATEVFQEDKVSGMSAWVPKIQIGGRIKKVSSRRTPNDPDTPDGIANEMNVSPSDAGQVIIELSWVDQTGNTVTREVTGPLDLLELLPAEWGRRKETHIHNDILLHPQWPPRQKDGEGWFSAIKSHRVEDQEVTEGWEVMGWVPSPAAAEAVANGHPAFIVGTQVLGISREHEAAHTPGVTSEILPGAERYGVNDQFHAFADKGDLDGYKDHVAAAIREAVEAFIVESPWTSRSDEAIGAMLLAAALRPACPRKPRLLFDFVGEPGSGKSWAASFVMGFWQARGNSWSAQNLPGAAMDTFAATEHSIARTPIWVIDDLAPSASRQIAEQQEASMDQLTRAAHNGGGKRRGNADGSQRGVSSPRALTILTAENKRSTQSIRERVVEVEFAKNRMSDSRGKRIEALTKEKRNPLSIVTAALVRFWLHTADIADTNLPYRRTAVIEHFAAEEPDFTRWETKNELASWLINGAKRDIQDVFAVSYNIDAGTGARRAGVFSELIFTLDALGALARWAGIPQNDPVMRALDGDVADPDSTYGKLVKYAASNIRGYATQSNAKSLISAITMLLRSGQAHLENPLDPGRPPIASSHVNAHTLNRELGWVPDKDGDWKPLGQPIGMAGRPDSAMTDDEWIALLNPQAAFTLAKSKSGLIPAGQKSTDTWRQVWREDGGSLVAVYSEPSTADVQIRARFRKGSQHRPRGVPLRLSLLLDGGVESLNPSSTQDADEAV